MDLQYVLVVVATLLASIQADDMSNISNRKVYCGKKLSQALSTICRGKYYTLNKQPITHQGNSNGWGSRYLDQQRTLEYPYRSRASASTLMTNFRRRKRRGVFNECCEKPCSQEELASYCASRKR